MPVLETARLTIRPLVRDDLDACHALFAAIDASTPDNWAGAAAGETPNETERLDRRRSWLWWAVDSTRELARLNQPPLGDRAIVDRATNALIGLVGFVPSMVPLGQLPSFGATPNAPHHLELGMFWAVAPNRQGKGVASEAAAAMLAYAFERLDAWRVVATTHNDNLASQGVMRRIGMTVERNPYPDPFYFQSMGWIAREARR
ncbi:MAG TPA: GNAT family N-acetyltransferase [Caulobacteraceae bacterium]|nr:GNAT family N-acetyltransferase [Caulobacteraceae bacterium]